MEKDLQSKVNELLDSIGVWYSHREKGRTTPRYHTKGEPDIVIWDPLIFIELKDEGQLSAKQSEFRDEAKRRGIPWYIARTVDEVVDALRGEKILYPIK